jgi:hypothetical protein
MKKVSHVKKLYKWLLLLLSIMLSTWQIYTVLDNIKIHTINHTTIIIIRTVKRKCYTWPKPYMTKILQYPRAFTTYGQQWLILASSWLKGYNKTRICIKQEMISKLGNDSTLQLLIHSIHIVKFFKVLVTIA